MKNLDLRIQKTYLALITSFEDLLNEKEFEEITVTELCDHAMIRRPTFYKHFLDKYDFLTFFIKNKMKIIFDDAFQKSEKNKEVDFFVFVFEQLLKQEDNILFLILNIQMRPDIMIELETIQEYGQEVLTKQMNNQHEIQPSALENKYKAQMIMGLTIQSVYWYKNNQENMNIEEITKLYKETLKKIQ